MADDDRDDRSQTFMWRLWLGLMLFSSGVAGVLIALPDLPE